MHLVGCLYYLYQWSTIKQISDNEIYLLIKYIKSVLWIVVKRLSYIEDARCLKVNGKHHRLKFHWTFIHCGSIIAWQHQEVSTMPRRYLPVGGNPISFLCLPFVYPGVVPSADNSRIWFSHNKSPPPRSYHSLWWRQKSLVPVSRVDAVFWAKRMQEASTHFSRSETKSVNLRRCGNSCHFGTRLLYKKCIQNMDLWKNKFKLFIKIARLS